MTLPAKTSKYDTLISLISTLTATPLDELPESMKPFWHTPLEVFFSLQHAAPLRIATCIKEPKGDAGLEGFAQNEQYLVQAMELNGKSYFRVWPPGDGRYYECCGPTVFCRYFELLPQTHRQAA